MSLSIFLLLVLNLSKHEICLLDIDLPFNQSSRARLDPGVCLGVRRQQQPRAALFQAHAATRFRECGG